MKTTYWQRERHKFKFHEPKQIHLEALGLLNLNPGEKVLDLACASGSYCLPIVGTGATYIGLDISKLSVRSLYETQLKSLTNSNWAALVGDAENLPLRDDSINKVFCVGSFSFLPNQTKAIREVHRVLKEDGLFAVNIVNVLDWHWFRSLLMHRSAIVMLAMLSMLARALGRYFTPLQRLFNHILKKDLTKVELSPPIYPKFTFLVKRFVINNGFRIISLQYSFRSKRGSDYSKEKVSLVRRLFCEGVTLILQER